MDRPKNVKELADGVAVKLKAGGKVDINVGREVLFDLIPLLAREGLRFASDCVEKISDPRLRDLLYATLGGSAFGAVIGGLAGGPPGIAAGAAVGAVVGAAFAFSLALTDTGGGRFRFQAG